MARMIVAFECTSDELSALVSTFAGRQFVVTPVTSNADAETVLRGNVATEAAEPLPARKSGPNKSARFRRVVMRMRKGKAYTKTEMETLCGGVGAVFSSAIVAANRAGLIEISGPRGNRKYRRL